MDPYSSDFTENAPEPRPRHRSGFRRLALLLPLVAAVPISIVVLSQRNNGAEEITTSVPPTGLTPTSGLESPAVGAPAPAPSEETPPPDSETVEPGELSKILAEAIRNQSAADDSTANKDDEKPVVDSKGRPRTKPAPGADITRPDPQKAKIIVEAKNEKAKPAVSPSASPKPARISRHVVQSGDTLYSLGRRYGIPTDAISIENGIGPTGAIRKGQNLKIPTVEESKRLVATQKQRTAPPGPVPHPLRPVAGLPEVGGHRVETKSNKQLAKLTPLKSVGAKVPTPDQSGTRPPASADRPSGRSSGSAGPGGYPHANGKFVPTPPATNSGLTGIAPSSPLRPVNGNPTNRPVQPNPTPQVRKLDQCIGYIVQPNDTLPSIAAGHSTTVGALAGLNGGILRVSPGQLVVIPINNITAHCAH